MKRVLAALLVLTSTQVLISPADAHLTVPLDANGDKPKRKPLTDAQIKTILIGESIAAYPGNCPCPYSTARNGSRCGRRSAYTREGGAEPLCYPNDVSAEMVKEYRERHPEE